ncbi:ATP/GTP-binding protein [Paenarthrobacter sp. TYUT067]|uniref:TRAFAC clade GTPase domain-containing protein n=1 Tax=Paenarthrobacter sp. TYUT067 TaxID=2926245 RepID=UPI00202DBF24|nr:ATP/GTP-binding protein [Paenarthrobacter sp. TYUT067]MCM0614429.1 ATP/GTP-binding protein [Paenarthrobacter sp. TYUT067]
MQSREQEQHIAVFGESGSGKTVMVSSFYGATQEQHYLQKSLFDVVADSAEQHRQLHQTYLGMKNSAQVPDATRFSSTSYTFSIKLKDTVDSKTRMAKPFDALRLVWHDYPGEWFEQDVSGATEAQDRVGTFKSLLGSDVALLLVDGQRLLDHSGEEEKYLKALLTSFRRGLLSLKGQLLEDGTLLRKFPRIWIMALSKSDLLPNLNVYEFRDLLIEKARDEIDQLHRVLAGFVEVSEALSFGEDFVLLSSAKFDADKIEVTERVGLELILPMAAMLPLQRHARWAQLKLIPGKLGAQLLTKAKTLAMAAALLGEKGRLPGRMGRLLSRLDPDLVDQVAKLAGDKLRDVNSEAVAKRDYLAATLTRFQLDLEEGEEKQILFRSRR